MRKSILEVLVQKRGLKNLSDPYQSAHCYFIPGKCHLKQHEYQNQMKTCTLVLELNHKTQNLHWGKKEEKKLTMTCVVF